MARRPCDSPSPQPFPPYLFSGARACSPQRFEPEPRLEDSCAPCRFRPLRAGKPALRALNTYLPGGEGRGKGGSRNNGSLHFAFIAILTFTLFSPASAIEPSALAQLLAHGEKVTVIDVRSEVLFQRDHIPGAINVPGSLVPEKRLPALGRVVVCDEGLGRDTAAESAARELNRKPGISAEVLEGGFAGWQAHRGASTKGRGVHSEDVMFIAYDQLKRSKPDEMVLVDLRKPRPQTRQGIETNSLPPLTDLAAEFPQTAVTQSPFALPQTRQSASGASGKSPPPVLVLIDDGDGSAQTMARTLKANGVTRVVVLAGGESILARRGQPGLQRRGQSLTPGSPVPTELRGQ